MSWEGFKCRWKPSDKCFVRRIVDEFDGYYFGVPLELYAHLHLRIFVVAFIAVNDVGADQASWIVAGIRFYRECALGIGR